MGRSDKNCWLNRYAVLVACATFVLIIAGALVTSNDAGLSVPDWPTSFGTFRMPRMVGGVMYEHGHRMIAGTVGILTILLAVWLWWKEARRWVRWVGLAAVLAVVAQAVLGGITVLFYLPAAISTAHATLAQLFFCLTFSLALFTRPGWRWDEIKVEDASSPSLHHLTTATTGAILIQLVLGAAFRHSGFGIAPHLVGAGVVSLLAAWTVARILMKFSHLAGLLRPALLLAGLLLAQVSLGIGSYVVRIQAKNAVQPLPPLVWTTTTHVAVGALVLVASLFLTYQGFRHVAAGGEAVRVSSAAQRVTT
jgi:cytochrome c oxidase assembly protein subunit 15